MSEQDTGEKYNDKGMLGSYRTSEVQFRNPEGVKTFSGYGADDADLELGFCQPVIRALPEYDKVNYQDRYSRPKLPDEDDSAGAVAGFFGDGSLQRDFEFREKERTSKGFLARNHIPTDR